MEAELKNDDYLALAEVFGGIVDLFVAKGKVEINQPYTFQCVFKVGSENDTFINHMKLIKDGNK